MELCGEQMHSCVCILLENHDEHMPHLCKCGGAWDQNGLAVCWPRGGAALPKRLRDKFPMPEPGAKWRYEAASAAFVRNDVDTG